MPLYQIVSDRIEHEQQNKKTWVYDHFGGALVTRFFPTGKPYPQHRDAEIAGQNPNQPTMLTPWGKILCPRKQDNRYRNEVRDTSQATLLRALQSIVGQLLYDVFQTGYYALAFIPSVILGVYTLIDVYFIESDEETQRESLHFAQEICLGNALLAPYFAMAIVVDFLRESSALVTRTLATAFNQDTNAAFSIG